MILHLTVLLGCDTNIQRGISSSFGKYAFIQDKRARQQADSQYRIAMEEAAYRMHLRTGTQIGIVCVNEYVNPVYFCTANGDFPKMIELVATLERAKQQANTRDELYTDLQDVLKAVKGTANTDDGVDFMTSVGQHLRQMGVSDELLNRVRGKFMDASVNKTTTINPADVLKNTLVKALEKLADHGFINVDDAMEQEQDNSDFSADFADDDDDDDDDDVDKRQQQQQQQQQQRQQRQQ